MKKIEDISGRRFGKLVAVRLLGKNKWANYYWECICDCGKYSNVASRNLKAGRTKSCGCLVPNCFKKTHGMTDTHFYYVWQSMLYRTRNKDARFYEYYGGRGISVCSAGSTLIASSKICMIVTYNIASHLEEVIPA